MPLTYTRVDRKTTETVEKITIVPYKDWAMFTAKGNTALRKNAEKLVAALDVEGLTLTQKVAALTKYMQGWKRICKNKSTSEAHDTAVRESVYDFFQKVCRAIGLNESDNLWDELESEVFYTE